MIGVGFEPDRERGDHVEPGAPVDRSSRPARASGPFFAISAAIAVADTSACPAGTTRSTASVGRRFLRRVHPRREDPPLRS
jgi:hypothetical protein